LKWICTDAMTWFCSSGRDSLLEDDLLQFLFDDANLMVLWPDDGSRKWNKFINKCFLLLATLTDVMLLWRCCDLPDDLAWLKIDFFYKLMNWIWILLFFSTRCSVLTVGVLSGSPDPLQDYRWQTMDYRMVTWIPESFIEEECPCGISPKSKPTRETEACK